MFDLHRTPLGIYEKALPDDFSWEEKMLAAKKAGFDFMELSIDESRERLMRLDWKGHEIKNIRELVDATGIGFSSMCLSGHRKFPFGSKDIQTRRKAYEIMEKAILLCQRLGIPCIQLATYDVYYEKSDKETEELFFQGLKESVEMAAKAGVILAMEIMDTAFAGTMLRIMHYLREIQSPYLKVYPDIGNLSQFSTNPELELELGIMDIAAIHVKETKPGVFKGVPFGEGTVRFAELFAKLHALKYSGRFMTEMWADNSRKYTMDEAVAVIMEARKFVADKMLQGGYTDI